MTASTARLARIVQIRDRQQQVAQAQFDKAEAELAGIETSLVRVAAIRRDLAPGMAGMTGDHLCAVGEFGIRLDGLRTALTNMHAVASAVRLSANAARLEAWQNQRAVNTLHDRARTFDAKRTDLRIASQFRSRAAVTRGDER